MKNILTFAHEAFVLARLDNANIIALLGLVVTDSETWIVTDFADHGNLENFAKVLEKSNRMQINPLIRIHEHEEYGFKFQAVLSKLHSKMQFLHCT